MTRSSNSGEARPGHSPDPSRASDRAEILDGGVKRVPDPETLEEATRDGAADVVPGDERILAAFRSAKDEGRAALMPYLMAGFPDRESGLAVAAAYADSGADLIELGVPFSDPLPARPPVHDAATQAP